MNFPSLDFTNWREHPSDNRYTVFFFKTAQERDYFENLLKSNKLWYEYHEDKKEPTYPYYFAVNKINSKQIIKLNHLTIGKFRQPFISSTILRYVIVILSFTVIGLGIIGYLKSH